MIVFENLEALKHLVGWSRKHMLFPRALVMRIDSSDDPAAEMYRVSLDGNYVEFYAGIAEIEDICRCHLDEGSMRTLRSVMADMLLDQETFKVKGMHFDEIPTHVKELVHAFANYFKR